MATYLGKGVVSMADGSQRAFEIRDVVADQIQFLIVEANAVEKSVVACEHG